MDLIRRSIGIKTFPTVNNKEHNSFYFIII